MGKNMLWTFSPTLEQSLYPIAVNHVAINLTAACAALHGRRAERFAKPGIIWQIHSAVMFWLLTSNQPCSQLNRYKLVTPWVFSYLWQFRTRASPLSFPMVVSPGRQRAAKTLGVPARWWEHRAETTLPLQEIRFEISMCACQKSDNVKTHPPSLPVCVTPVLAVHFEGSGWVTVFSRQVSWMGSTHISQSPRAICT